MPVRWLLVHPGPNFSVADVHNGWAEALTGLGEQVQTYGIDRRLTFYDAALIETGTFDDDGHAQVRKALTREQAIGLAAEGLLGVAYRWWPDVVLCTSAFFTPPEHLEVMRARGHKIVMLFTEGPYQTGMQLKMAQFADLSLVNDPCDIDRYRAIGPAEYMPHAYRPTVHHPGPADPELACDLAFVGTGFPSRVAFFEADGPARASTCSSPGTGAASPPIRRCASTSPTTTTGASTTPTPPPCTGPPGAGSTSTAAKPTKAATPPAGPWDRERSRWPRPGCSSCGTAAAKATCCCRCCPPSTAPKTPPEQLRWWLAHDGYRNEAARAARAAVADRTFDNHAKRLLRLLDNL